MLVFGNGGSASDAQHLAAEFVGRFQRERRAAAAIALTTDTSILTAIGNDYGFDRVFARQIEALGYAGRRRARDHDERRIGERARSVQGRARQGPDDDRADGTGWR